MYGHRAEQLNHTLGKCQVCVRLCALCLFFSILTDSVNSSLLAEMLSNIQNSIYMSIGCSVGSVGAPCMEAKSPIG